jgi:hypothetical protein
MGDDDELYDEFGNNIGPHLILPMRRKKNQRQKKQGQSTKMMKNPMYPQWEMLLQKRLWLRPMQTKSQHDRRMP